MFCLLKKNKIKVSVSILKEKDNIKKVIEKINNTNADYIHLDIMDGSITENKSFSISDFKDINEYNKKPLDIHIMSSNLDKQINDFIKINPSIISFQIENCDDIKKYIDLIKSNNIKVGLALDLNTDISSVIPFLDYIDLVLIMSVKIGYSSQKFDNRIISKIKKIRKIKKDIIIEVDGGINNQTVKIVKKYTDIVVSGSYITNSEDYNESILLLK